MPEDNHSPEVSTGSQFDEVTDLIRLPDEDFAREFGLNVSKKDEDPTEETPEEETPETDAEAETSDEPEAEADAEDEGEEGESEEDPKPEAKDQKPEGKDLKLATQFTAYDDEGEYDLAELAKVKIKFKANGKERDEPLDKVVRLAQFGFHNEEVTKERDYLRGKALPELTTERDGWKERAEKLEELAVKWLQDPDEYVEAREQHAERLTPEYRAQEAERRLQEREQQDQARSRSQQSVEFTQTQIMPKLESLMTEFPSVTPEEVLGMFTIATAPYARNGVVPPEAWGRVAQMVDGEIATRMASLHESRAQGKAAETKKVTAKVTKAQEEATKAKRQLARAVKSPSASGSTPAKRAPKARKIETAEDAILSIEDEILASLKS